MTMLRSSGTDDLPLDVLWEDGEFVFCSTWRVDASGKRKELIAVRSTAEDPTSGTIARLTHEYELKDHLDGAWAAVPQELLHERGQTVLVLESPGGRPLDRLAFAAVDVGRFLRLGVSLSDALGQLHERGLIHKDIKPSNILVNAAADRVWLTGFGIASRFPREKQPPAPPEFVAGTLAYMAPEQTGRMNRSIDSRSDLYALGVTSYQMLTGALPFVASDPMEWIHCHIARQPASPADCVPGVPLVLSAIVMKLLAKAAEDRYQTARGLQRDLQRCLADWEGTQWIDPFPLGEHDVPGRLLIPEKLYGRERQIETLLAAFDSVLANGVPELVLVSGYSGVGKSSVVNELHKVLVPPRGLFSSGKFDQYKRDIPYATLAQAFQGLIRQLLGKSDAELAGWRDAFQEALRANGQLMIDLVPELKHIIGDQPPVPELGPQDAQRRFQRVFCRFLGVFAQAEHPLALFLDDLQWLDAATLDLIEYLMTQSELKNLMLIGAYRDNEVDAAHPLMRKLEAIRQTGARMQEIWLAPLGREHLRELTTDALRCAPARATPLVNLMHETTAGNPFFVIQFLHTLADEGLLTFDVDAACWSWDLERFGAKGYTDNVVDLMVGKLVRRPEKTQQALQQFACLGAVADTTTLAIVLGISRDQVHVALWDALCQELVERQGDSYRFIHDRVQEAAYSMIPEASRAGVHLRIGRLLTERTPPEQREEAIFEIVNQFNRGAALIASWEEREQVAQLNLIAGKRAKASTAYASALTFFKAGSELLADDRWTRRHELSFQLESRRAECEFLTGDLATAEERLAALSSRAADTVERAGVTCLRMDLYTTLNQSDRAVEVGLDYLRHLGIEWSPHPTEEEGRQEYARIWSQLGTRTIEELVELTLMRDPASLGTLDVLTKILPPALFTDPNLFSVACCRAVSLSLESGHSDGSCVAYVWFGMIAGPRFGNYRAGFEFGRLGYELVEKRGLNRFEARTCLWFAQFVVPWTKHVLACRNLMRRAFEAANRAGDLTIAGYACNNLNTNLLAAGDPLVETQREAERGFEFAQKALFGFVADIIVGQLGLIRTLRGLTPKFGCFDDRQFDEGQFEHHLASDGTLALPECWYWTRKLQARFFAGDYGAAVDAGLNAERLLWTTPSIFERAECYFYGALARAASYEGASPDQREQLFEVLTEQCRQIETWAENCPENFENRAALVQAEIARIEDRALDAMNLYERAIASAQANSFVHNEALAYELAGRFYMTRGFKQFSHQYLREARHCYLRWGADGKVRHLDELYPYLREDEPTPGQTTTIRAPIEHLDLATVVKVSQAISGEIVLQKLIDTLMRTAVEQAGAERGLLILLRGAKAQIEAEATIGNDTLILQQRGRPVTAAVLPESVLHYVLRTRESVILGDAATQSPFDADSYIRERKARSILCLPLITQAKLMGVLYLENNLTPHVFAPARIAVLKLVASQAAIALENSRLYGDLQEREAKIRRLVDANIIGILIFDLEGQIIEANDAFLRIVGYGREDLVSGGMRWADLTPPEWRDRNAKTVDELKMVGTAQPYEKEYFRKDGSRVPVLVGATSFEEAGNQGVAFVLDLTERKRVEEALRRSEAFLAKAQQVSLTGSFSYYSATGELTWSEELYHIFDFQPSVRATLSLFGSRYHPEDIHVRKEVAAGIRRGDLDFDYEHRLLMPDASIKHIRVIAHGSPDKEGSGLEYFGAVQDLTQRRVAEIALDQARSALLHVSRITTLGVLTAAIAHEVNQPLSGIVTNASTCLRMLSADSPNVDGARETARRAIRDGNRAAEIISRLRRLFAKREGSSEIVNLNEASREVISLSSGELKNSRVILQSEFADDLPSVQGDRIQLQQVILNLIRNAADAMSDVEDRPRLLVVRTTKMEPGGVLVAVQDSGLGIDPANLDRIFDAFYTTKPDGLGIGLSVCRTIVEAHGGKLWAAAACPHGAIFQFTLPITRDGPRDDSSNSR
jgi:PAS domain S-box-containing protein